MKKLKTVIIIFLFLPLISIAGQLKFSCASNGGFHSYSLNISVVTDAGQALSIREGDWKKEYTYFDRINSGSSYTQLSKGNCEILLNYLNKKPTQFDEDPSNIFAYYTCRMNPSGGYLTKHTFNGIGNRLETKDLGNKYDCYSDAARAMANQKVTINKELRSAYLKNSLSKIMEENGIKPTTTFGQKLIKGVIVNDDGRANVESVLKTAKVMIEFVGSSSARPQ